MRGEILVASLLVTAGGCEPAMKHIANMHGAKAEPHASAAAPDPHVAQSGTTTVDLQGGYDE